MARPKAFAVEGTGEVVLLIPDTPGVAGKHAARMREVQLAPGDARELISDLDSACSVLSARQRAVYHEAHRSATCGD